MAISRSRDSKADFGTIGDCVLGTWYYGTCAGEFTIHTGSASIVKNGTSLSVTYVPERELTLVVVLEGRVWVTPG